MDLLFLKPRKSDEAGPWEHCPGAHTRTAFAGFCVDRVHVYKPSVMCSSKFAETSKQKHSLRESWWDIGFAGNWWCKKQGNKVLSEGKM